MTQNIKYFIITGDPGVGKTTIIQKICSSLNSSGVKTVGFLTEEVRRNKMREGFDVISLTGERGRLARDQNMLPAPTKYSVGKYGVLVEEFENVALPAIKEYDDKALLVIDEIGKMEFFSSSFKLRIKEIFSTESKNIVLATIPSRKGDPIIESIRNNNKTKIWMLTVVVSDEYGVLGMGKTKKENMRKNTAVGTFSNVISQIQNLPNMDLGRKFRTPCKTGNRCGKVIKRLMVPKLAQLENTIMGIMKELSKMPPGSRLPDKYTKTEPIKLLLDQNYKEDVCMDKLESCLKEDKRRKRILKKLFFKKYNSLRQDLIGYGGRRLWGGEGNLFYR